MEIAVKLHHPHNLALHDSGEADGFLYGNFTMNKAITSLLTILIILVTTLFNNLAAQDVTTLTPGMLIRISAPSVFDNRITGFFISLETDTLLLRPKGQDDSVAISLASVNLLESRSQKKTFRPLLFTLIGFLGGGAFAITIAGKSGQDLSISGFISYWVGAAIGAAVGGQIGRNLDKKWEPVPLPQPRVGRVPAPSQRRTPQTRS